MRCVRKTVLQDFDDIHFTSSAMQQSSPALRDVWVYSQRYLAAVAAGIRPVDKDDIMRSVAFVCVACNNKPCTARSDLKVLTGERAACPEVCNFCQTCHLCTSFLRLQLAMCTGSSTMAFVC